MSKRKPRRTSGNRNPRRWLELTPEQWQAVDRAAVRAEMTWPNLIRLVLKALPGMRDSLYTGAVLVFCLVLAACGGIADQRAEPMAAAGAPAEPDPVAHCELSVSPGYPCYGDLQVTCDTAARAPAELVGAGMECISGLSRLKPDYTTIWCCK